MYPIHILETPSARTIQIFKKVKSGGLSISINEQLLTITSRDYDINDENIQLVMKNMKESKIKAAKEAEEIAVREQMLKDISNATKIPLAE